MAYQCRDEKLGYKMAESSASHYNEKCMSA